MDNITFKKINNEFTTIELLLIFYKICKLYGIKNLVLSSGKQTVMYMFISRIRECFGFGSVLIAFSPRSNGILAYLLEIVLTNLENNTKILEDTKPE